MANRRHLAERGNGWLNVPPHRRMYSRYLGYVGSEKKLSPKAKKQVFR